MQSSLLDTDSSVRIPTTVEPRSNDPRSNDTPGFTMGRPGPGKKYSKMYEKTSRSNDIRSNDIPSFTMEISGPKRELYPATTI